MAEGMRGVMAMLPLSSRGRAARQQASDEYFEGVGFAVPSMRENLPSLSRYFEIPLDYSSVE